MDDTISRQTAIDAIDDIESEVADGDGFQYAKWREYFCELPSAQPNLQPTCNNLATDCVRRQDAIDSVSDGLKRTFVEHEDIARKMISKLPSAQPELSEITDEQAILHLQSTGWMQNHDREMYESGLREQLADDSDDYDSLIPCEDAVSRQTLQKELALYQIDDVTTEDEAGYNRAINDVQKMVLHLPSIQPKSEERTAESAQNVPNDELISKKTAIDQLHQSYNLLDAERRIEDLPSAQSEIIMCEDCIHNGSFDTDCPINWNGKEYCSFAERRTDERSD